METRRRQPQPLPKKLYKRFLNAFTQVLSQHICLHKRIIRLHLVFYASNLNRPPNKRGYIEQLWIRTYYALKQAISRGDLIEHPDDPHWVYLPGTDIPTLTTAFQQKSFTYNLWTDPDRSQQMGMHAISVIRGVLAFKNFPQPKNPPVCYLKSGATESEVTPDAFILAPTSTAFEIKDGLSDVWPDPTRITRRSVDQQQLLDHFEMCKQNNLRPGLIAVKVDPLFYDFSNRYNGLVFELGSQIFPPYSPFDIYKNTIATDLGFKNIVLASEDPPYPQEFNPLLNWLDKLKL
jgi:hypothetical protein